MYALPMISVDGTEYAAMPQMPVQGSTTMRIFGFGDKDNGCQLRDTFTHSSGKTIFGFAQKDGGGGNVAYEYRSQICGTAANSNRHSTSPRPSKKPATRSTRSAFPGSPETAA